MYTRQKGKWRVTLMPSGLTGIETIGEKNQFLSERLLTEAMDLRPADSDIAASSAPGGDIDAAFEQMKMTLNTRVFSVYGEELLGPLESQALYDWHYFNQDNPAAIPRRILDRIVVCGETGDWLSTYYLNSEGYSGATDRELGMTESGQSGLHRVTRARQELAEEEDVPLLTPEHDVEHACRNTSCCNPGHTWRISGKENNNRKDDAVPLEAALISGQLALLAAAVLEKVPDQGPGPVAALLDGFDVVISSRVGAFKMELLDSETITFTLLNCVAREKMKRRGKKPTKRYQKTSVNEDQFRLDQV